MPEKDVVYLEMSFDEQRYLFINMIKRIGNKKEKAISYYFKSKNWILGTKF